MEDKNVKLSIKIMVVLTFLAMVIVNGLANILPLNGITTGAVSDSYQNLFAPAGYTFSIWGVIYLFLGAYTVYQIGFIRKEGFLKNVDILNKIGPLFTFTSVLNIAWIFSWHYKMILLSVALMLGILLILIYISLIISKENFNIMDKLFIRWPFSIYFGWITVASIANIVVLLVSIGWNTFGISEDVWMMVALVIGMFIGTGTMIRLKDMAYGFVLIWAYVGILVKHTSPTEYNSQYFSVLVTLGFCLIVFVLGEYLVYTSKSLE